MIDLALNPRRTLPILTAFSMLLGAIPLPVAGQEAVVRFSADGLGLDIPGMVLTVDGVNYSLSDLPVEFAWKVGSNHSFSWRFAVGAGPLKRYVWVSASGLSMERSGWITVPPEGGSVSATYKTQYLVTLEVSGLRRMRREFTVVFGGERYIVFERAPIHLWIDSGSSIDYEWISPIEMGPMERCIVVGPEFGTIMVDSPKTVSATYVTQYRWLFNTEGLGEDSREIMLMVDGEERYIAPRDLPASFWWNEGSTHTVVFPEHVDSAVEGKRYACHDPPKLNITVNKFGSVAASYHAEYMVSIEVASGRGRTKPVPGTYWFDDNITLIIEAEAEGGYAFEKWAGSYTSTESAIQVKVQGAPLHLTASFTPKDEYRVTLIIMAATAGAIVALIIIVLRRRRVRELPSLRT
jgi:hypothetical protein